MNRLLLIGGVVVLLTASLSAAPSVKFSTAITTDPSWNLHYVNGEWRLSFVTSNIVTDYTDPADLVLAGDNVSLPTMAVTNIQDHGSSLTATLIPLPGQSLRILANNATLAPPVSAGGTVFTATVASGGSIEAGTNYLAYQDIADDLQVTYYVPGYSTVLDQLHSAQNQGYWIDLAFGGVSDGVNLYDLLKGKCGTASGNLSGEINAIPSIPAPGAFLLGSLGAAMVGWLRVRRQM